MKHRYKCKYAKDKSLESQYSKRIWKMFTNKPAFTYCNKYKCVCYGYPS